MQTEPRPQTSKPGDTSNDPVFLFIRGDTVVGRLSADCYTCAWNAGKKRWPGASMAMLFSATETAAMEGEMCIKRLNRLKREYRG